MIQDKEIKFCILDKYILQFGQIHFAIWTMNLAVPLFLRATLSSAGMIQDERSHSTKFQNEFQTLATNMMKGDDDLMTIIYSEIYILTILRIYLIPGGQVG